MRTQLTSAFVLLCCLAASAQELPFRRADANADGLLDIGDPIFSLCFIFAEHLRWRRGSPVPRWSGLERRWRARGEVACACRGDGVLPLPLPGRPRAGH